MMNGSMVFNSNCLEISLKTNQSPGKLKFTDVCHGTLFFQGRPGILKPTPLPLHDYKMELPIVLLNWNLLHLLENDSEGQVKEGFRN